MKILIANIGSTSLKWRLFDFSNNAEKLLHKGGFERVTDYAKTIEDCLVQLKDGGFIQSDKDLAAVGFKTVLAKNVSGCVGLDERVLKAMEDYNGIAPAHNPPYITGIRLFAQRMPATPLVGLFETAFYQFAPEAQMRYAVPDSWYEAGIRRFGFHGASHKFIAERSAELIGREDVAQRAREQYVNGAATPVNGTALRVVSCHLGGSSSITGIRNGVAIGNSLGLSNDIRDIQEAAAKGNPKAKLAIDVFVASARHWIGSYFFELNGTDAIVFTAGIGENRGEIREAICADLDQLGIVLDPALNAKTRAQEAVISAPHSRVKIMVIPTNEELVVAREVKRFLENCKN